MFNLQDSLDTHKRALQKMNSNVAQSGLPLKASQKHASQNAIVTVTKESIKKSLIDSGILTTKGEFTNLNIS